MPELGVAGLRAASWLVPAAAIALTLALRPPSVRAGAAAIASTCWCFATVLALNEVAASTGWWRFNARGGVLAGMPVETWLGWAAAWGALPALALSRIRIAWILAAVAAWDWIAMPRLAPLVVLGEQWLMGELIGLAFVLAPALWLTRLTLEGRAVVVRAALQCLAFTSCTFWLLPGIALAGGPESLAARVAARGLPSSALVALGGPFAALALAAVAEFAARGRGTPLPLDPPRELVTSGPYAFVRNPMQVGMTGLLALEAAWLESIWLALAVPLSIAYAAGFAAFDESADMRARFGGDYDRYRATVRSWLPHWRPRRESDATLYVGAGCDLCEDFARLHRVLAPAHLEFVPAQRHGARRLTRLTYRDGAYEAEGLRALARALEHTALPLALLGFAMRAPLAATVLQWIADVSGGGPRELPRSDGDEPASGRPRVSSAASAPAARSRAGTSATRRP